MATDRLIAHLAGVRPGSRHDTLALCWEPQSSPGVARVIARGQEAVHRYQSDLAGDVGDPEGGRLSLGRIGADGRFFPLIRRTIPSRVVEPDPVVVPDLLLARTDGSADAAGGR